MIRLLFDCYSGRGQSATETKMQMRRTIAKERTKDRNKEFYLSMIEYNFFLSDHQQFAYNLLYPQKGFKDNFTNDLFSSFNSSFLPTNTNYHMSSAAAASSYIHSQFGQFNGLEMSRVY